MDDFQNGTMNFNMELGFVDSGQNADLKSVDS